MQRSGKTVSSEELLNHVWDENADPFSQVIRVHIYSLRKKIKQITGQELIHTKKGIGYSFGENNYD